MQLSNKVRLHKRNSISTFNNTNHKMNRLVYSLPKLFLNPSLPCYTRHLQSIVVKPINYKVCTQFLHTAKALKYCSKSLLPTAPIDDSAKLVKDVIVFKYGNARFFKYLNLFAISQLFFWTYLGHFAFTCLRDAPVDRNSEDAAWWNRINLGENKYRNALTAFAFLIGYGIFFIAWMYTLRSVRFLVLRKGGTHVTIATYTPFGRNRLMDVPLRCISAQQSRSHAKVYLPLKVKDRMFFYLLDMQGEFLNHRLYDFTVGLKRKL